MRRIFLFALVGIISVFLSSCLVIEQNLTVEKDGSGVKSLTIDMGEMFTSPLMGMVMAEEKASKELEKKDSTWLLIDELRDLNPQWTKDELALLENASSRIQVDVEQNLMLATITMPFRNFDELKRAEKLLAEANRPKKDEGEEGSTGMAGGFSDFDGFLGGSGKGNSTYTFDKNTLGIVTPIDMEMLNPFAQEDLEEEALSMMKGMMEGSAMIYSFTLPGTVKKVNGMEGAVIDGNTVTQSLDLIEYMDNPEKGAAALNGEIKYK